MASAMPMARPTTHGMTPQPSAARPAAALAAASGLSPVVCASRLFKVSQNGTTGRNRFMENFPTVFPEPLSIVLLGARDLCPQAQGRGVRQTRVYGIV